MSKEGITRLVVLLRNTVCSRDRGGWSCPLYIERSEILICMRGGDTMIITVNDIEIILLLMLLIVIYIKK